jgi:LysM repeat protein
MELVPETAGKRKAEPQPSSGKVYDSTVLKKYRVKKGDSPDRIARENNLSLEKSLTLNRMEQEDNIHPGQVIFVQ